MSAATPPVPPFPVPSTAEIQGRLTALSRERDTLRALLKVSLRHDRLRQLQARMEAAANDR
jgi:hypothetical protein